MAAKYRVLIVDDEASIVDIGYDFLTMIGYRVITTMESTAALEMFQKDDKAHLNAMNKMQELMKSPDAMHKWFNDKRAIFDSLPKEED